MAVPAVNTFGMLNEIGNNFRLGQLAREPLPREFGGQPSPPGFFARLLSGQNPFAQPELASRGNVGSAAISPAAADPRIDGGGLSHYLARVGSIENPSGDRYATSPTGAGGEYQFIPSTWAKYGKGGDIHGDQTAAVMDFTRDNNAALSQALGRPPTAGELYLAHQQGAQGALTLLYNPNSTPAKLGLGKAVSVNGGNPNAPASLFTSKWMSRFSDVPSPFGQPQMAGGAGQASPGITTSSIRLAGPVPAPDTPVTVNENGSRLNMAPGAGAGAPSGIPAVGSGATTTPMGQGIPNPSMETLYRMMQNPYQEGIAKILLQNKLKQMNRGQPTSVQEFEYAQTHPDFTKYRQLSGQVHVVGPNLVDPTGKVLFTAPQTGASLTPEAVDFIAKREIGGDTSGRTGLGSGIQGSANLVAVANRIAELGGDPQDLLNNIAEYSGQKAGSRTLGQIHARTEFYGNTADKAGDLALESSSKVPRSNWTPIAELQMKYGEISNDPAIADLIVKTQTFANEFAKAINPTGQATVYGFAHAYTLLTTANNQEAYSARVAALKQEIINAREQAKVTIQHQRKGGTEGALPGRRQPKAGEVWGGFKFKGGDPADKNSWEKP